MSGEPYVQSSHTLDRDRGLFPLHCVIPVFKVGDGLHQRLSVQGGERRVNACSPHVTCSVSPGPGPRRLPMPAACAVSALFGTRAKTAVFENIVAALPRPGCSSQHTTRDVHARPYVASRRCKSRITSHAITIIALKSCACSNFEHAPCRSRRRLSAWIGSLQKSRLPFRCRMWYPPPPCPPSLSNSRRR